MSICDTNYKFKSVTNISEDLILNIIESNLKMFFDWSFLNIGAWFDAKIPDNTIYGFTQHYKLMPVSDPSYQDGRVWQSIRKDWVWETVSFNNKSPIQINGIYVNNQFVPRSAFKINYPEGRIIFNSAADVSSLVLLNYSYRNIQVYRANDAPWLQTLQYSSFNTDNPDINQLENGQWSIGSHHRVQMPCIVIESVSRSRSRPHEIGNNGLVIEQDILFNVIADNRNDRNKLLDIIRLQQDIGIWLFDTNLIAKNNAFPLDHEEDLKINAKMYPELVDQYKWKKCWFKNFNLIEILSPNHRLHQGSVRGTLEIVYN